MTIIIFYLPYAQPFSILNPRRSAMTIQKASTIKFFRYLAIFCAITMGFFSIVATSEDDVKDALNLTFDENADLTTEEVTVDKTDLVQEAADFEDCAEGLTVQSGLDALEDVDLSEVDINSVEINALQYLYNNADYNGGDPDFSCVIEINEIDPPLQSVRDPYNTTLPAIQVNQTNVDWTTFSLTQDNIDTISYYLANLNEDFDICVECDVVTGEEDTFTATFKLNFDVNIKGDF